MSARRDGFTLVEVLLALGLFSILVLALVQLLDTSLTIWEETDAEREVLFGQLVDRMYEHGKALSIAEYFEIDDVIDPADTRRWLTTLLESAPPSEAGSVRPNVDTW